MALGRLAWIAGGVAIGAVLLVARQFRKRNKPNPYTKKIELKVGSKELAQRLRDVEVVCVSTKERMPLGKLWQIHEGPVAICLFRRFGCGICKMTAASFGSMAPYFASKNVRLVGIGFEHEGYDGMVKAGFKADNLFVDEHLDTYTRLLMVKVGWWNLWGLNSEVLRLFKLANDRGHETNFVGDWNQLGGTFVVDKNGSLLYGHYQTPRSFEPNYLGVMEALGIPVPEGFDPYSVQTTEGNSV